MALRLFSDTSLSYLHITGSDVRSFLQGQLTCDLSKLTFQTFSPTALCQYQGKTLTSGLVYLSSSQEAFLIIQQESLSSISKTLQPYAALESITISSPPTSTSVIGLSSTQVPKNLPSSVNHVVQYDNQVHILCLSIEPYTYLIHGPKAQVISLSAQYSDAELGRLTHWQAAMIKTGILFLPHESQGAYTPNMLSLVPSPSVSLSKGCYLGQEVIARTYHLGQVKRQLHTFCSTSLNTPLPVNTALKLVNQSVSTRVIQSGSDDNTLWFQVVLPTSNPPYEFVLNQDASDQGEPLVFEATLYHYDQS